MANKHDNTGNFQEAPPRVNELRRFLKTFLGRPVVIIGAVIILVLLKISEKGGEK